MSRTIRRSSATRLSKEHLLAQRRGRALWWLMSSTALVGAALGAAPAMAQTVPAPGESITLTREDTDPDAAVLAGFGAPAGTYIFHGTSNLRGDIYVNGGTIRTVTEGGFGSGTIHLIDPTAIYGVTGIYGNDIDLAAIDTENDPATLRAEAGVTATLTGSITESLAGQNLVFEGVDGSGFVLTNSANRWTGITTIRSGTLTGTTGSIGGSSLSLDNGSLVLDQAAGGTFAQNISGAGSVTVRGLAAGQTLSFTGDSNLSGAIEVTDASHIVISGAVNSRGDAAILLSGAGSSLDVNAGGSIVSAAIGVDGTADDQTVTNFGTITGRNGQPGIHLAGSGSAVVNGAGGRLIGSGSGGGTGVYMDAGGSITNSGTILSPRFAAVYFGGGDAILTNNSGGIIGQEHQGDYLSVISDAANTTVNNAGIIYGLNIRGDATITNSGKIEMPFDWLGIFVGGTGTLINSGEIIAGQSVRFLGAGSSVVNQVGGVIWSDGGGMAIELSGSVENSGYISSFSNLIYRGTVHFTNPGGILINHSDGVIENEEDAYAITSHGEEFKLVNDGKVLGLTYIMGDDSSSARNVTIVNTGSMAGVRGDLSDNILTVDADDISFDNSGSIIGPDIDGVIFYGNVTGINRAAGIISGDWTAISITSGSLENLGTLRSTRGYAVETWGTVINSGIIDGGTGGGALIYGGSLTNQAGGTITSSTTSLGLWTEGSATVDLEAGSTTTGDIVTHYSGTNYVTIAGVLNGSYRGVDDGVDLVTIATSAAISGTLDGGGDNDALTLVGDGAATLVKVTGFESATLIGGGSWTLGAANDVTSWTLNAGTLITGGEIADSATVALAAGGTLQLSGDQGVAGISGTGTIALTDHSLSLRTGASIFGGSVTGDGALVIDGANLNFGGVASHGGGTEVRSGALSGSGRITGNVFIRDGAHLAGAQGTTLTMGALDLGAGAQIDVALAAPSEAALFDVTDNLTLDGTLNVTAAPGFGAGVYRLFTYGGALTDNGMALGTVIGADAAELGIQTSVAGTVNLVNDLGSNLLFWDGGDAARHGNGAIDGGTGSWSATGSNWTSAAGVTNGAMTPMPGFAVFAGTAGTVTIDGSAGAIRATGLQFAANGYTLAGGPLELTEALSTVRVGDGSAASAGWTATISAALTGAATLWKQDYGTLILSGANSYTGGTEVVGGTLALGASNVLADNGGLIIGTDAAFDLAGFDETVADARISGTVRGTGTLRADGIVLDGATVDATLVAGALIHNSGVSSVNSAVGATNVLIASGTLRLGTGGSLTGAAVDNRATLDLSAQDGGVALAQLSGAGNTLLGAGSLTLSGDGNSNYAGVISGAGGLIKTGTGTLTLSGANSYAGATEIRAGTLTGTGSIAGAVTIADGAHLAGAQGTTLSVGSLALGAGAQIDVSLTSASTDALFDVAGNLTLDGTLNVAAAPGFGAGVYRLFDYGGTLTDNGLVIGTVSGTTAADLFIQTRAPGVVNLVSAAGADLSFWDGGEASGHFNDLVDGGSGRWSVGGENWADAAGALNGPILPTPGYAVFQGKSGTVTVDTGAGAVSATGMQFAVDGYTLAGDTLTLMGDRAIIRVGDGTAAGAAYRATISALLTGAAALVKSDLGTLVLTGTNSYTGGTIVQAGTLIGNTDTIRGNLLNNGTAIFDQAADATFAGEIGGTGTTIKRGGGALTLGGISIGRWSIEQGGLISTTERFKGDLAIAGGAYFAFDQSSDGDFGGSITGSGELQFRGRGKIRLSGDSSAFGGTATVSSLLIVNGKLGGTVDLLAGGRLQGSGTIGAARIAGTLAPGNSIGTLTIDGPASFLSGSRYEVEVNAAGLSDRTVVNGAATIQTGAMVSVLAENGSYGRETDYTILTAGGGISGTFSGVTSNLAYLTPSLRYAANAVTLRMTRNAVDFDAVSATPNQAAVAPVVEALGSGNEVYESVVGLSAAGARDAFSQLAGSDYASMRGQMLEDSRFVRDALLSRGALAGETGVALWGRLLGSWGQMDASAQTQRYRRDTQGLITGFDGSFGEHLRLGAAIGYSAAELRTRSAEHKADGYHASVYMNAGFGMVSAQLGTAYAWNDVRSRRSVAFGTLRELLSDKYGTRSLQVFGEVAAKSAFGPVTLQPFIGAAHVSLFDADISESGGAAALAGGQRNAKVTYGTFGVRTTAELGKPGRSGLRFAGSAALRHAFEGRVPLIDFHLAGSRGFTIAGAPIERNSLAVDGGLELDISPSASFNMSYTGNFGDRSTDHGARASLTFRL